MTTPRNVENRDRVVDQQTGEKLTTKKEITINTTADEFFMVFFSNLSSLYQLKNATEIHVLAKLASMVSMNTNSISLTTGKRQEIGTELGISQQNLTNVISRLKKTGLITGDKGEFTLNPALVWKGSTKAREKWMTGEQGIELMIRFKTQKEGEV